jgi:5-formyltetrahydrofolate cyclo-ligase
MLETRNALSPEEIGRLSGSAQAAVIGCDEFRAAEVVGAYFAFGSEAKTDLIIAEARQSGKRVALPTVGGDRIAFHVFAPGEPLVKGRFGIMEPLPRRPVTKMDLVIVPGIAFDRQGYRLGYGKGYYDRFLSGSDAFSMGLAYGFQVVDQLPHESHDLRLDATATENGIIASSKLPSSKKGPPSRSTSPKRGL